MGKTEKGAVWLNKKNAFSLWLLAILEKHWRQRCYKFLKLFTDLEIEKIDNLKNNKDINELKILLANEATTMLHGSKSAKDSEATANKTFKDKSVGKDLPTIKIKKNQISNGINILDLVLLTKLGNSKGEVRRMIKNNGLKKLTMKLYLTKIKYLWR